MDEQDLLVNQDEMWEFLWKIHHSAFNQNEMKRLEARATDAIVKSIQLACLKSSDKYNIQKNRTPTSLSEFHPENPHYFSVLVYHCINLLIH